MHAAAIDSQRAGSLQGGKAGRFGWESRARGAHARCPEQVSWAGFEGFFETLLARVGLHAVPKCFEFASFNTHCVRPCLIMLQRCQHRHLTCCRALCLCTLIRPVQASPDMQATAHDIMHDALLASLWPCMFIFGGHVGHSQHVCDHCHVCNYWVGCQLGRLQCTSNPDVLRHLPARICADRWYT